MLAVKRGRLWLEKRTYFQNILLASLSHPPDARAVCD